MQISMYGVLGLIQDVNIAIVEELVQCTCKEFSMGQGVVLTA